MNTRLMNTDDALRSIANGAAALHETGNTDAAYDMLAAGVEAFLRGMSAVEIVSEARAAVRS